MIKALTRTPGARLVLLAYAVTAVVCAFLPLADHVGFELAAILTPICAIVAPYAGFAAMRLGLEAPPEGRRPARAAALAGMFAVVALALPVALILLNGVRRPLCDPIAGSVWIMLLPAPTAWLAATLGALARLRFQSLKAAIAAVVAVEVGTVATSLIAGYVGPVAFGYDHFAGYYDSMREGTVPVTGTLVSFRAATVLWGAAAVAVAGALGSGDRAARRMHASWAVGLCLTLITVSVVWGSALGWRTTDADLRRALNGEVKIDNLVLHFARNSSDREIETMVREATFQAAQVRQALKLTPTRPVHIWNYSSTTLKARLVGRGGTPFAKPYRHEIHTPFLSSLRHELVHAMAAEFAGGPWRAAGGIVPNAAITEGFAEAYGLDDGSLSLLQDAKAMREVNLAPDLEKLLSLDGFGTTAVSRAYAYSGAFIRYLDTRFDPAAMRRLYRTGNLKSIGDPKELIAGFGRMLDTVKSDANARATSTRDHVRPALAQRPCAREVSAMVDSANSLATNRRWNESLALFDRACALQPDDPMLVRGKLAVIIRMRPDSVQPILAIADSLWRHPRLDPGLEAGARIALGNELWRRGDVPAARVQYARAAALPADPATRRNNRLRLMASADSANATLFRGIFADPEFGLAPLLAIADALTTRPSDPLLLYYLAAQYYQRGGIAKAAELAQRLDSTGMADADLRLFNRRTLVNALADLNRCDEAAAALDGLRADGGAVTDIGMAADRIARCRFGVARGWKPMW